MKIKFILIILGGNMLFTELKPVLLPGLFIYLLLRTLGIISPFIILLGFIVCFGVLTDFIFWSYSKERNYLNGYE